MQALNNFFWRLVAKIVTIPAVTDWLIRRAQCTPYTPILGRGNDDMYMDRWWLFNPYKPNNDGAGRKWAEWLPSIRIHHIVRPDDDVNMHDHPWNARTIVLRGFYVEERPYDPNVVAHSWTWRGLQLRDVFVRSKGYTGTLTFGQVHRISNVSYDGVYTLFITYGKQGTWGFMVDGKMVPWRKYLGGQKEEA